MKILIVHPAFYVYGGAELVITELCKRLYTKHSITVLTSIMIPDVREELKAEVKFSKDLKNTFQDIYKEYDIINFHNHPVETYLKEKYPSIWQCNEPPDIVLNGGMIPESERLQVVKNITEFIVSDKKNAERFELTYGVTPRIVPYGVDYDFWNKGKEDRFYWNTEESFSILHVGMIHPRKKQFISCKILKNIVPKIPNAKLILAGFPADFIYLTNIINFIRENSLTNNFSYVGNLSRERLRDLYHSADILIHPIGDQGGWLTPIEALSSGLLSIVSPDAGISSLLNEHQIGIVSDNYEEIILDYYNNREKYSPIVSKSQEFIRKYLSWDNYAVQVENIMNSIKRGA